MIFTNKSSYGVKSDMFLSNINIGYVNFSRVKIKQGTTAGSAFSVDENKQLSLIKSYNEYLERLFLGIPLSTNKTISSVNLEKNIVSSRKYSEFGYGNHEFGFNDTTGTSSGKLSEVIIQKALTELIEKNEVFCFWYGLKGEKLKQDKEIHDLINDYNFISNMFKIYVVRELSNYSTVIVMGFLEGKLLTSGVCCSITMEQSLILALKEAKGIEWQTFNNPLAKANKFSDKLHKKILKKVKFMDEIYKVITKDSIQATRYIETADWINHVEISVIGDDINRGVKTIKCISKQLLNSVPIKINIERQKDKEIIKRYLIDYSIDCPIQ